MTDPFSQRDMAMYILGQIHNEKPGSHVKFVKSAGLTWVSSPTAQIIHICKNRDCQPLPDLNLDNPLSAVVRYPSMWCDRKVYRLGLDHEISGFLCFIGTCPKCGTIYVLNESVEL